MRCILRVCAMVLVAWGATTAKAGDPCPISYVFHDIGVPDWLKKEKLLDMLVSKDIWIGMSYRDLDGDEANKGVMITKVWSKSPAQKAGLKKGDVLVSIAGDVVNGRTSVNSLLQKYVAKNPIELVVHRFAPSSAAKSQSEGKKAQQIKLVVKPDQHDPLLAAMIQVNNNPENCADVYLKSLTEDVQAELRKQVLSPKRRFYCEDAHTRLLKNKNIQEGDIVYIRGSRRVLISTVGFYTVCAIASQYDGEKMTRRRVAQLFERITRDYTNDRYENP